MTPDETKKAVLDFTAQVKDPQVARNLDALKAIAQSIVIVSRFACGDVTTDTVAEKLKGLL